jgi:K+-transporting ATPase ATPase A chain
MTQSILLQLIIFLGVVLLLVKPLGWYIAQVYQGKNCGLNIIMRPFERAVYRLCGIESTQEMDWKQYLTAMLLLNLFGMLLVYAIQRLQFYLPFNPAALPAVNPDLAFNTAASFVTNTNWQAYAGESTLSYFTQSMALTVQNFLSAATGMSLLVAFIRGLLRHETCNLGNFWTDTVRGTLYILLPISLLLAILLTSQGVIQNYKPYEQITLLSPQNYIQADSTIKVITTQTIPMGPVASQVAIKQLGSNGGGYFNVNSAHPFENPTPFTNLLEMLAIILIPAALCYTFGYLINDRRQGWALLAAMTIILIPCVYLSIISEQAVNSSLFNMGIENSGNMEGKETRFGIVSSALWATLTTAVSNGSVNAMLDSFNPVSGFVPMFLIHAGEIVFGGVGCGLYGMLMIVIISVFVAGLMVGRTPEYLGKKIEPFEMKMAVLAVLVMPIIVLVFTGVAVVSNSGISSLGNPGAHGFSEILYAYSSMGGNNGSSFAGLNANTSFYNISGAIVMLITRYWIAIPTLAVAGSLARKKIIPVSPGTLATHTPLFIVLLIGVITILAALSFLPSLSLGPIVEQLILRSAHAS